MNIIADMHVHVYPAHTLPVFFEMAAANFRRIAAGLGGECACVLALAERSDMNFFEDIVSGGIAAPTGWQARACASGCAIEMRRGSGESLYFVSGRQIVTSERLEVLALGTRNTFPDGMETQDAICRVIEAGAGAAVLPWGAGKWMGRRGRIVENAIRRFDPSSLWLGDSSLRPAFLPLPAQMRKGNAEGFRLAAGSDPLPISGEERWVAAYASLWREADDAGDPAETFLRLLSDPARKPKAIGKRCSLLSFLRRVVRYEAAGRGRGRAAG